MERRFTTKRNLAALVGAAAAGIAITLYMTKRSPTYMNQNMPEPEDVQWGFDGYRRGELIAQIPSTAQRSYLYG